VAAERGAEHGLADDERACRSEPGPLHGRRGRASVGLEQ
jgi:hypothetical protein